MTVKHVTGSLGVIAGFVSLKVLKKQLENISQEGRYITQVELILPWCSAMAMMTSKGAFQDYFSGSMFSVLPPE